MSIKNNKILSEYNLYITGMIYYVDNKRKTFVE